MHSGLEKYIWVVSNDESNALENAIEKCKEVAMNGLKKRIWNAIRSWKIHLVVTNASPNPFPLILKGAPPAPNIKTGFRGLGFYIRGAFGASGYESD